MRTATPADLPALLPLLTAFYEEEELTLHPDGAAALASLLADPSLGFALVEELDGGLVGYVVLTFGFSLELGGRDAFVDELFVAPSHRRAGVGGRLLRAALDRARAAGVRQVLLEVAAPDAGKMAFYARAGFALRPHPLMVCGL